MMSNLCDLALLREIDPKKFVTEQWALINLVAKQNVDRWENYRSIINQVEIIVAVAMDEKGAVEDSDLSAIEKVISQAKAFLLEIKNMH